MTQTYCKFVVGVLIIASINLLVGCRDQPIEPDADMIVGLSTKANQGPNLTEEAINPILTVEAESDSEPYVEMTPTASTVRATPVLTVPIVVPTTVVETYRVEEAVTNEREPVGITPTSIFPAPISTPTVGQTEATVYDGFTVGLPIGASVPKPPKRDLIALTLSLKSQHGELSGARYNKAEYEIGVEDYFYVVDFAGTSTKRIKARVEFISENAHWFFQEGIHFDVDALEKSAEFFEEMIIPLIIGKFGSIWPAKSIETLESEPPRISILHANISGVLGYFNSSDEYSKEVNEFSNERKMMYINSPALSPGEGEYLRVLAHELQHVVHWNHNEFQDTWLNEGLSQAMEMELGFLPNNINAFRSYPLTSLVHWPITGDTLSANYGAAFLFTWYLENRFFQDTKFADLIDREAVGIGAINEYLSSRGEDKTFDSVFEEWTIANFLPEASEETAFYREVNLNLKSTDSFRQGEVLKLHQPQYSARYIDVNSESDNLRIKFEGTERIPIIPLMPQTGDHCWWSNLGNSINSTLTRSIDLSNVLEAQMEIKFWQDIEEHWDYIYVEISSDGGSSWDILSGNLTTDENPFGLSFGPGYTGSSNDWLTDKFDLSAYAGSQVLLRFHYVTDSNYYGEGFCLDELVIPEIDLYYDGSDETGWISEGFLWTDNFTPQDYFIYVIQKNDYGTSIREVDVNSGGHVEFDISGLLDANGTTLVIGSLSPNSTQETQYVLTASGK